MPKISSSRRPTGPIGPSPATVSSARTALPSAASTTPRTWPSSTNGSATGVAGHTCAWPDIITCWPAHCMNWPSEKMKPVLLVQERRDIRQFEAPAPSPPAASTAASASRIQPGRREAPCGSSRYSSFSFLTRAASGISATFSSGSVSRIARARVTTPDTPNAMSSARS